MLMSMVCMCLCIAYALQKWLNWLGCHFGGIRMNMSHSHGNVTSAGWQVTLCDPIWHVSFHSGVVLVAQTAIRFFTFTFTV